MNFVLILLCLCAGYISKKTKLLNEGAAVTLNVFVIYISLPALTFSQVPGLLQNLKSSSLSQILAPALTPWLTLLVAIFLFALLGRIFNWSKSQTGALIMTSGFGNTSFVGFPIIEALYGAAGLQIALLFDQPGTFLSVSTLGVVVVSIFANKDLRLQTVILKILRFPPFIALILALLLSSYSLPNFLMGAFERLGLTLVPLALFSVGLQLRFSASEIKRHYKPLTLGLSYKLFLAPLLILVVFRMLGISEGQTGSLTLKVSVIESAMAPMITAGIMASEAKLAPELVSLMVGIGIPLSILTTWLWSLCL